MTETQKHKRQRKRLRTLRTLKHKVAVRRGPVNRTASHRPGERFAVHTTDERLLRTTRKERLQIRKETSGSPARDQAGGRTGLPRARGRRSHRQRGAELRGVRVVPARSLSSYRGAGVSLPPRVWRSQTGLSLCKPRPDVRTDRQDGCASRSKVGAQKEAGGDAGVL